MQNGLNTFLGQSAANDPSWQYAYQLVNKHLQVPNHVWKLFKDGWNGQTEPKDFLKVMGFSKLNPTCLLSAAEIEFNPEKAISAATIEQAILTLGMRLSVAVLAINLVSRVVLSSTPPPTWKTLFAELIRDIEIGYKLGGRTFDLGIEGGAMIGFSSLAGEILLLADKPKDFKAWYYAMKSSKPLSRKETLALFGCEPYQISALCLQALGFGSALAVGVACAAGKINCDSLDLSEEILRWKAAYLWLEALREGRNYPADLSMRSTFPELIPPPNPQTKNLALEVLHTEVAKLRSSGSKWLWHLPSPNYQAT